MLWLNCNDNIDEKNIQQWNFHNALGSNRFMSQDKHMPYENISFHHPGV